MEGDTLVEIGFQPRGKKDIAKAVRELTHLAGKKNFIEAGGPDLLAESYAHRCEYGILQKVFGFFHVGQENQRSGVSDFILLIQIENPLQHGKVAEKREGIILVAQEFYRAPHVPRKHLQIIRRAQNLKKKAARDNTVSHLVDDTPDGPRIAHKIKLPPGVVISLQKKGGGHDPGGLFFHPAFDRFMTLADPVWKVKMQAGCFHIHKSVFFRLNSLAPVRQDNKTFTG